MAPCRVASERQLELLVEFAECNRNLALGVDNGPLRRQIVLKKWVELSRRLNAVGVGCRKTPMEWRRYWTLFKSRLRDKVKNSGLAAAGTGDGPTPKYNTISLTPIEERALGIIGKRTVEGKHEVFQIAVNKTEPSIHSDSNEYLDLKESHEEQFLNDIAETIDVRDTESADILNGFDSETPAPCRRHVDSSPLKRPHSNTTNVATQPLRKSLKVLSAHKLGSTGQKQQIIDQSDSSEEQEFQQRFEHREEMHLQALRHNEEKHAAELRILDLKARLLEIEIDKLNK